MAKLNEDPKVIAIVDRAVAKAERALKADIAQRVKALEAKIATDESRPKAEIKFAKAILKSVAVEVRSAEGAR